MNVHFIAIGGAIMHNLAIALKDKGYRVSGSDDVIFDPSKSLLEKHGLLPESFGFFAEKITKDIDVVILGMHAKIDNPELTRAMELGLKVYSFPEFVYEQSKDKIRVVVAGSHGKTTITSMIMHVLRKNNYAFDYLCGSSVAGFDNNVKLSNAPIIILEGDEYLTSALQKEPKFIYYKGNYALLSGIEWDHINVFPTNDIYFNQFEKLIKSLDQQAGLVYFSEDKAIQQLINNPRSDIQYIPYSTPEYTMVGNKTFIKHQGITYPLEVFGRHNMQNIEGARNICALLGVADDAFFEAISSFSGAGRRLELIRRDDKTRLYKDFAHSPSKLTATVNSVKEQYPNNHLIACMELHTFSSLKKDFLPQYAHSMDKADTPIVFINEATLKQKGGETFSEEEIRIGFANPKIKFFTDKTSLENYLYEFNRDNKVFLMMSSGNFGGIDLNDLSYKIFNDFKQERLLTNEKNPSIKQNETVPLNESSLPEALKGKLMMLHLTGFFTSILGPLYFYNTSDEILRNEAKKAFNFQASYLLIGIVLFYSAPFLCFFPFLGLGILFLLDILYSSVNIINANNNRPSKYPRCFEFIR